MRLVADESVDQPIVEALRQFGHDVIAVAEMAPGVSDDEVLELSEERDAVLLTADKDFGELVYRQGRAVPGIVLIRLAGVPAVEKQATVSEVVANHESELPGAFTVVTPGMVRIRRVTT